MVWPSEAVVGAVKSVTTRLTSGAATEIATALTLSVSSVSVRSLYPSYLTSK